MSEPIGSIGLSSGDIRLDRAAPVPLFAQLARALERRIHEGTIAAGVRLPAERELAAALGLNRATVGRAYRALEEQGLVASRVGSGTTVVAAPGTVRDPDPVPILPPAAPAISRGIRRLAAAVGAPADPPAEGVIDFALMFPDVALFPRRRLSEAVARALARGDEVLQYGAPTGLASLRRALARRLADRGITAGAEEVLIVNGIQQALDLLAKVLLDPGDAVAVEAPTYANVLPLIQLYGGRVEGVPLDAEGMVPGALERVLAERPKFLYTIPSFHNPTGTTMSRARRAAVLAACRRHGTLIVEDGYEEDLRFAGEALPPLAALDRSGSVIYLGTFSKGLFPGLRLGYLVARGEVLSMLTLAKRYSDYHADLLAQAVLGEILESGDYDRHLVRLRRSCRERMQRTLRAMSRELPAGVRFSEPEGGYIVWVELPEGVGASAVAAEARRRGVAVLTGRPFFAGPGDGERALRLSVSRTDPERIEAGVAVLGQVLREAIEKRSSSGSHRESPALV